MNHEYDKFTIVDNYICRNLEKNGMEASRLKKSCLFGLKIFSYPPSFDASGGEYGSGHKPLWRILG